NMMEALAQYIVHLGIFAVIAVIFAESGLLVIRWNSSFVDFTGRFTGEICLQPGFHRATGDSDRGFTGR
ncbi:MAG: hypothetical protein ACFNKK_04060, partial [Peptidiphaga sp.]